VADVTWKASPEYVRALNRAVGKAIRKARDECGLTQEELATRVVVSRGSIANIERGEQTLAVPLLLRLAEAIEVPSAQLLVEPAAESVDWLRTPPANSPLFGVQALDEDDRAQQVAWVSAMLNDAINRPA
jgi:transcriptional regulator with XRE-family HTH domain